MAHTNSDSNGNNSTVKEILRISLMKTILIKITSIRIWCPNQFELLKVNYSIII